MNVPLEQVVRRGDVLWRGIIDGVLVRPPGGDEVVKLAGTGATLWAVLDEPMSFADLCAALAESHDAAATTIADDLSPVIADLIARRVLAEPADGDGHGG